MPWFSNQFIRVSRGPASPERLPGLIQMEEVVTTGEHRPKKHALLNCDQTDNSSDQDHAQPPPRNPRKRALQGVGAQQNEWDDGSGKQSAGSEIGMFTRRIDAAAEIKRD